MRTLRLADFLSDIKGSSRCFHAARHAFRPGVASEFHDHDFAEVFWIGAGQVALRSRSGEAIIGRGHLSLVFPRDAHSFRALGDEPCALSNIAFPVALLDDLRSRFPGRIGDEMAAREFSLPGSALARLDASFALLGRSADLGRLALERFLVDVVAEAALSRRAGPTSALAPWLDVALASLLALPEPATDPVSTLAFLAGRSREHLSRVIRRATGMSALAFVRATKLALAESALALSDEPITNIAFESGFGNLGTFYAAFKKAYGCTPAVWRRRSRFVPGV